MWSGLNFGQLYFESDMKGLRHVRSCVCVRTNSTVTVKIFPYSKQDDEAAHRRVDEERGATTGRGGWGDACRHRCEAGRGGGAEACSGDEVCRGYGPCHHRVSAALSCELAEEVEVGGCQGLPSRLTTQLASVPVDGGEAVHRIPGAADGGNGA